MRRRRTHDGTVPLFSNARCFVIGITTNSLKASPRQSIPISAKWCRPYPRHVKLNVDASFHVEISAGSVGAVIQDHQGNFLGAKCVYLSHVTLVVMAKACWRCGKYCLWQAVWDTVLSKLIELYENYQSLYGRGSVVARICGCLR
jgi:hypothetical protein